MKVQAKERHRRLDDVVDPDSTQAAQTTFTRSPSPVPTTSPPAAGQVQLDSIAHIPAQPTRMGGGQVSCRVLVRRRDGPRAPPGLGRHGGNARCRLRWAAPSYNGAPAITLYKAYGDGKRRTRRG